MLKELILKYGKEKINTLTKYPSILTLHAMGQKGRLSDELTTNLEGEKLFATEKIDGTNVRLIFWKDEFLIGSRKFILHYSKDFYWDEALGIVNQFYDLEVPIITPDVLTVVYGELYGGKVTAGSKNYGKEKHGFKVFDIAEFDDLSILDKSLEEISSWRETPINTDINSALRYGQNFVNLDKLATFGYNLTPTISFILDNFSHETVFESLKSALPETTVALTDLAQMKAEGLVVRNFDRSKIVKVRFDDYRRTLRK